MEDQADTRPLPPQELKLQAQHVMMLKTRLRFTNPPQVQDLREVLAQTLTRGLYSRPEG